MKLTLSVRSFQVPATPGTAAWPPSLPSVPTSRATRETSSAKEPSWSTIAFTVVPMRANSPFSGWPSMVSAIFWVRSPAATATITRATSVVGRTRSSTRPLTESRAVDHPPCAPSTARALGHAALAADDAAEAHELGRQLRVALDELVVGGLELAHDALAPRRETMGEVARGGRAHRRLQAAQDFVLVAWPRGGGPVRPCLDLARGGGLAHVAPDSSFGANSYPCRYAAKRKRTTVPGRGSGNATGRTGAPVANGPMSMRQLSVYDRSGPADPGKDRGPHERSGLAP